MLRLIEYGRCVYDGYQRGTALKCGTLADEVWLDPVFLPALLPNMTLTWTVLPICSKRPWFSGGS
jgi:hypothetical protein